MKHLLNHLKFPSSKEERRLKDISSHKGQGGYNYFVFALLGLFLFCTVGSLFAGNFSSISKQYTHQVAPHAPFDYNDLALFAELNEEDVTDFDSNFIGLNLQNDHCNFYSHNFFGTFFIDAYYLSNDRDLPIFLSNRSIRI